MTNTVTYLADIWLLIIGFFLLYYVVTDGFDLGVGIISLFTHSERYRSIMMTSLENIWHTNQTWLVVLGGMLFGAFPLFYGLLLSSLYIPILVMLFGLIFRSVAFEFCSNALNKRPWELSFAGGSLIAAIAQGFALGGLLSGLPIENGSFVGSVWGWLNPFSILIAAGVVFGYAMLGANYLIAKTEQDVQTGSYYCSFIVSGVTICISISVHAWTIARYTEVAHKWLRVPDVIYVSVFPLLALCALVLYYRSLLQRHEYAPLLWNAVIIVFSFIGLSVEMYPNMIPNMISSPVTVYMAAASPKTLLFMLYATAILLPVILIYTAYKYSLFRGKVLIRTYVNDSE